MPGQWRRWRSFGACYGHCCNPYHQHFGPPPPWWGGRPTPEEERADLEEYISFMKDELKAAEEALKERKNRGTKREKS
jgi:hypothetical protein